MSVEVYIPTPFRTHTGGETRVALEAATVGELLQRLGERFPELRGHVLTSEGGIPEHLNVFVGEEEVRSLRGLETPLSGAEEVALVPAMAGGAATLLRPDQVARYDRQIRLDEVGVDGQRKLLDAKVLVVGAGGLGSPTAIYLAAAGVGTLGIVDGDRVDRSNLHRQPLHFDGDVGRPKTESAREHLERLNPDVRVVEHRDVLTSENALEILRPYDIVVNGCDNFPTRYLVNDACVLLGKPLVDASILKFEGQCTVYLPGQGCYRCLFPSPPPPGSVPSCAEAGIIGALAGHMGTLQALETVKLILGVGQSLAGRMITFDALDGRYRQLRFRRDPECPVCGDHPTITELIDYEAFCGVPQPRATVEPVVVNGHAVRATAAPTGAASPSTAPQPERRVAAPPASFAPPEPPEVVEVRNAGWAVDPEAAAVKVGDPAVQWVDVRQPDEYRSVRIPGVTLIPLGLLPDRFQALDPKRETILVCRSGQRSARATQFLRDRGFARAYNLDGGMIQWVNHRLPAERGL
ncbi:molybdopterin-synthase adenylyltransferase MoeB [Limnochorda pilosa]|uniref:Molybdenum cofactor biosynthesis protein MoeB n=1 Tax=Limnochorda pilosa TaxID=1555112 RepID=A0A0K2SFN0_LIMPI|nr:molybdopterin-synthase adenylyltransferase MoeB [Limnochorda pilosa]BAS25913.1 molybdenum cofactor biosynthesis protein MoeB [Limnochorda pilosa]